MYRIFFLLSLVVFPRAAPIMEPGLTTLYLLLDASNNSSNQGCWNEELRNYIETKIVGQKGYVYCDTYKMSASSPVDFAKELSAGQGKIFK